MQESDPIKISRQDAMLALYNEVGYLVAELCDVKQEDIYSKSKILPLPICRGLCWYAIRVAFDATYGEISKLTKLAGSKFTSAGISCSVNQAITLAGRSQHWSRVWDKVKLVLPTNLSKINKDEGIVIQIIIPKGSKDNIKFEIKEQQNK